MGALGRRPWLVALSLFLAAFFIFGGGYDTAGIFFIPIIHTFGWSRTRSSVLQTGVALAAAVTVPLVGWLMDRLEARVVMSTGAVLAGLGFLVCSQAHSYPAMMLGGALLGVGLAAATLLPCSIVVANWFEARRGLAMGFV